jgi:hypothetical protein
MEEIPSHVVGGGTLVTLPDTQVFTRFTGGEIRPEAPRTLATLIADSKSQLDPSGPVSRYPVHLSNGGVIVVRHRLRIKQDDGTVVVVLSEEPPMENPERIHWLVLRQSPTSAPAATLYQGPSMEPMEAFVRMTVRR